MSKKINNATIVQNANVYFDGKVNSRTVETADGEIVTLGFMQPGSYEFNTSSKELMTVLNGSMVIKRENDDDWKEFTAGTSFTVPKDSSFQVKVDTFADYSCSYS